MVVWKVEEVLVAQAIDMAASAVMRLARATMLDRFTEMVGGLADRKIAQTSTIRRGEANNLRNMMRVTRSARQ